MCQFQRNSERYTPTLHSCNSLDYIWVFNRIIIEDILHKQPLTFNTAIVTLPFCNIMQPVGIIFYLFNSEVQKLLRLAQTSKYQV